MLLIHSEFSTEEIHKGLIIKREIDSIRYRIGYVEVDLITMPILWGTSLKESVKYQSIREFAWDLILR